MTVATSAAIMTQAAPGPTGIDAWSGEMVGQLIACGLIQTQDTGQLTITGSGATATTNATQPASAGVGGAVGHILLSFTDSPLARGPISALAETTAGTGYQASATFTGIVITGATSGANSARATNVVSSGGVPSTTYTITTAGLSGSSGYIAGEKLTFSGGTDGAGHTFTTSGTPAVGMPTALTSGTPVVFRLDFGAQTVVTTPQCWITVGSGSNGSGTINGSAGTTAMTQVAVFNGNAEGSSATAYSSYFCYNTTYGFCKVIFKVGAAAASNYTPIGSFYIFRTNDTSGAATAAGVILITNASSTTGATSSSGAMQCATYASGAITSIAPGTMSVSNCEGFVCMPTPAIGTLPFGQTSFLSNGNVTVFNCLYLVNGILAYSAYLGFGSLNDMPQGNSFTTAIIGATQLTFLGDSETIAGGTSFSGFSQTAGVTVSLWM